MENLIQDVRYAFRSLVKSRRFALAAVITLALAIGVNSAMFSVIKAVLLEPWPVRDPSHVLVISERQQNGAGNSFSTPAFLDWKEQGGLLAQMGAHVPAPFNLSQEDQAPERIRGGQVSADLLPVLGVEPMLGRFFSPAEDMPGAGKTVILSYSLWKNRYGADPQILSKPIELNGTPYAVVGVMPAGFDLFGGQELLWTPLQLSRETGIGASPNIHWLLGFIRLPEGVNLREARAELDGVAARLHRNNPTSAVGFGVFLQSIDDAYGGNVRGALLMLMGSVAFVLLIACTNVANLLVARGASRRCEIVLRIALGASRLRIVRQLVTESLLLALTGGALGIFFAFAALRGILALHPPSVPRLEEVAIDGGVLAFSLIVSLAVGVLFGLFPAFEASGLDPSSGMRERESMGGRTIGRHRAILVVIETALASVLLIGTGLALKSLWSLRNVELGFLPDHVETFRISVPAQRKGEQIMEFYRQVADRLQALPGVEWAALARDLPMSGTDPSMPITVDGKNAPLAPGEIVTRYRTVGEGYFRALRIPVLEGRTFDEHDTAASPDVAIVSQSLARKYWPGESPLGKRLKPNFKGSAWCTVVGVVADVRHWGLDIDIEPTAYYPYTQVPDSILPVLESSMSIAVRSKLAESDLLHAIRAEMAKVDSTVPVYDVQTMEQLVSSSGSLRRFDLSLLGGFSLLALALALIGVYGVISYSVAQRTREIGVRMALGACSKDVLALVLKQGARLGLVGAVLGAVASVFLRGALASLLYGLSATDPLVLTAAPLGMVLVVVLASYLPARRAARVNPMSALRSE
jgi:putative ABC transport system permease protein